jgi:hypothetical protein
MMRSFLLEGRFWAYKTGLTPPLFIEVPTDIAIYNQKKGHQFDLCFYGFLFFLN